MAFTMENTQGYTQEELDMFNEELARRLQGVEPETDEYYQIEKEFEESINRF